MTRKDFKVISSLDLRYNFPIIRKNLARGQQFVLMHRGKVIAELSPPGEEIRDIFTSDEY